MSRRKNRNSTGQATSGQGRQAAAKATDDRRPSEPGGDDWADEAARARTADDPRVMSPHDAGGVPSTADRR
ncbi:hypothetical protein [Micromonospora zhanjiangensis]|uniref:Uncharacterized protein n=1 Tax=Micromonospora zhanjiangensis TaxID=1522057 RepID=A0ABV8KNG6_9ACTN